MAEYTIYSAVTGLIRQCGTHPAPERIILADDEVIDLSGSYPDDRFCYQAGHLVPLAVSKDPRELEAEIVAAVQERLDGFARTRGYDSILSASTYAGGGIPQFAAEGKRALQLRDETWAALYELLRQIAAGERPIPTSYASIESELPAITW